MTNFAPSHALTPVLLSLLAACAGSEAGGQAADVYDVTRGDLEISVTEQAEIRPAVSTRIKNEMEGQATILFLIEEGSFVNQGERLVELDSSELLERKAEQEIKVSRSDADRLQAHKELEIRIKEFEAEQLGGKNRVLMAQIDLEKYLGKLREDGSRDMGEKEQEMVEARADIDLALAEKKLAENKLAWSERLFEKGFITKDDLERDQIDLQRRVKNLRVAENELELTVKFTHPRRRIELDQAIMEAETELEGVIARGNAKRAQAEADVEASEKEYELAFERLQNLVQQIENSVVYAPTAGLVVYAQEEGRRGSQDVIEEGATVRERQTLIELPDVTRMVAQLKVHEAYIDKIHAGQPARIKVDAFPQRAFRGAVSRVSPVADSGSRWSNNALKVYKTEVALQGDNEVLKPGMTSSVTIVVAQLKDVVFVPLQAVQRQGAVTYVWLKTGRDAVTRPVDTGLFDTSFVEITRGLESGDQIYLAPPAGAASPELEQPEVAPLSDLPVVAPVVGDPPMEGETRPGGFGAMGGPRGEREAGAGGRPRRGGGAGMMSSPAARKFVAMLKDKHPALAERVESGDFTVYRDPEFSTARDSDPELSAAWDELRAGMRGGGGGGREGRGDAGDNGGARGGRRRGEGNE